MALVLPVCVIVYRVKPSCSYQYSAGKEEGVTFREGRGGEIRSLHQLLNLSDDSLTSSITERIATYYLYFELKAIAHLSFCHHQDQH